MSKTDNINHEEWAALRAYAKKNGRYWKAALSSAWSTGNYRSAPEGTAEVLQAIRNKRGSEWLKTINLNHKPA
ncbi:hypothetical protein [Acetobacter persici]|uniref:hypothetical protein n=1 Tax=Acetobacter persici TaxID=1076596 RepID=UPI001BA4E0ED|nr:hypothetical protein [Acetobacter persici]MBS1017116.1 hypothetical protein [Acetobacter persici]